MANGHGGARIGAGKKRKSLHDKILESGRNHHPLTVTEFKNFDTLNGEEMPPPQDYMTAVQKDGSITHAVEIYTTTWNWLNERNCTYLIPIQLI